jgi:hypothetical protein
MISTRHRPLRGRALALTMTFAVVGASTSAAAQMSFSSEIQSAWYPREGAARPATSTDVRGWSSVELRRAIRTGVEVRGDLTIYGSNRRRAVIDGEAALLWRSPTLEVAGGLLREQWGRFANSTFDALARPTPPSRSSGPNGD